MGKYIQDKTKRIFIPSEEEIMQKASEIYLLLKDMEPELAIYGITSEQIDRIKALQKEIVELNASIQANTESKGANKNKTFDDIKNYLKLWSSRILLEEGNQSFLALYIKNQAKHYISDIELIGVGESVLYFVLTNKQSTIKNKEILLLRELLKTAKQMHFELEYQLFDKEHRGNEKNNKLNELYELMARLSQMAINHLKIAEKKEETINFQLLNKYRYRISNNQKYYKIKASKQKYTEGMPLNQVLRAVDLII